MNNSEKKQISDEKVEENEHVSNLQNLEVDELQYNKVKKVLESPFDDVKKQIKKLEEEIGTELKKINSIEFRISK